MGVAEASAHGGRGSVRGLRSRRENIAKLVIDAGSLSVEDLADIMGVSTMTIYRDVSALEEQRLVTLLRGNVYALASALNEASAEFRMGENVLIKEAFVQAVEPLITSWASVMVDDSTSGIFVISKVAETRPLTVITNSLLAAREVESQSDVSLQIIGGEYQKWAEASCGMAALRQIEDLRADFSIMSASAISGGACYHPYRQIADVKRAMLKASEVRILLADGSKFARRSMYRFADLNDFEYVITDPSVAPEILEKLGSLRGKLIIA